LINEKELSQEQKLFVADYFNQYVSPVLMTIILTANCSSAPCQFELGPKLRDCCW